MRATEFLTELFTQPYEYQWESPNRAKFVPTGDKIGVDVGFGQLSFDRRITNIAFSRERAFDITGGGDQFRIMATVLQIIGEWVKRNRPLVIMFSASESSRVKLYEHMVRKIAGSFGYTDVSKNPEKIPNPKLANSLVRLIKNDYDRLFFLAAPEAFRRLTEAPIPSDWDAPQVQTGPGTTFKSRLAYAKQRAKQVGQGSSRVAFVIDYEGRPTVLKIAKNRKGLAQNMEEASILSDGYFKHLGILIPIIDFDTGRSVSWLHTEMAKPYYLSSQLTDSLGVPITELLQLVDTYEGKFRRSRYSSVEQAKEGILQAALPGREGDVTEMAEKLYALKSGSSLNLIDLLHPENWGEYEGRPVIIDAGFAGSALPLYNF